MISVIEEPKKPAFRIVQRNNELFVNEVSNHLTVIVNNNRPQKEEAGNKPEQELEVGLPPQPKEYIKYPEYDWLWADAPLNFYHWVFVDLKDLNI